MKVLFLYKGKNETGGNRVVVTQGKSLEKRGVEIEYFPLAGKGPFVYFRALAGIRKRLRAGGADLIHAHYGFSGLAGFLSAGKRPLVVSFMGSDLLGSHTRRGKIKLWSKVMICMHVFLARYFYSLTIVKSEQMKEKLLKHTRYAVIPNGVDLKMFRHVDRSSARQQLNIDTDDTVVLFPSGRNNPEKNFQLASAAAGRVKGQSVRLLEMSSTAHEEMNLWFNAADLLLVTSFHEGSPNIVKEAMATGCPVVSTAVGDIEWLSGDLKGHYLSGSDPGELAVNIEEAVRFRKENGFTEGRDRIIKLGLDAEKVADSITGHYASITEEKRQISDKHED